MPHLGLKTRILSTIIFFLLISFTLHQGSLLSTLLTLTALAIHEITHMLCCELLGYPVHELSLNLLGGCLKVDPSFSINPEAESLIAVAGPLANLLMVGGVLYLRLLGITNIYLEYWLQVNLFIGTVNLIPASPLDGGRILHAWLNKHLGLKSSHILVKNSTAVIGFLLLVLGLVRLFNQQAGGLFILIGGFIIFHLFSFKNPELNLVWKSLQYKKKHLAKKGFQRIRPVLVKPTTPLRTPLQHYGSNDYLLFFIQDKEQKMNIISEESAWNSFINQGYDVTFSKVITAQANKTCRIPSDEVE